VPDYPDTTTRIAQVLSHLTPGGVYQYDAARSAVIGDVITQCANEPYVPFLAGKLDAYAMTDSVPGTDLGDPVSRNRGYFTADQLERYASRLQRMATPYRVDDRGRASRSTVPPAPADGANGLVLSALDLANFDRALRDNMLTPDTLLKAWTPAPGTSAGLGWFVQRVGSDTVVWQFDATRGAYSSLMIKVPARDLTLILLANSDRLATPLTTIAPDITKSVFAGLFFRVFLI
jgi:CubicO group peptidase (beta-lactamase class C family)